MKKLILSLLLSGIISFGNISHGSTISSNEELQEKIVHRQGVGFSDGRRLNMEMINCSPTITFRSTDPNLKIIDVSNKEMPDLKAVPISSNNSNELMLVPNLKEEDNLLNKSYVPCSIDNTKKDWYHHTTYPLALFIPKNETEADYEDADGAFFADKETQQHYFLKVEADFGDEKHEKWFNFQSSLQRHLIIKKEKDKITISMSNEIYPRKSR